MLNILTRARSASTLSSLNSNQHWKKLIREKIIFLKSVASLSLTLFNLNRQMHMTSPRENLWPLLTTQTVIHPSVPVSAACSVYAVYIGGGAPGHWGKCCIVLAAGSLTKPELLAKQLDGVNSGRLMIRNRQSSAEFQYMVVVLSVQRALQRKLYLNTHREQNVA